MQPEEPSQFGSTSVLLTRIKPISELLTAITVIVGFFGVHLVIPIVLAPYGLTVAIATASYLALTRRLDKFFDYIPHHRSIVKPIAVAALTISILGMLIPAISLLYLLASPVSEGRAWIAFTESVAKLPDAYAFPSTNLEQIDSDVDQAVSRLSAQLGLFQQSTSQIENNLDRVLPVGYASNVTELRTLSHTVRIYRILRSPKLSNFCFYPGVHKCFKSSFNGYRAVAFSISVSSSSPFALIHWRPAVITRSILESDSISNDGFFITARAYESSHSVTVALFGNTSSGGGNLAAYWVDSVSVPDIGKVALNQPFAFEKNNKVVTIIPRVDGFNAKYDVNEVSDSILGVCNSCSHPRRAVSIGWERSDATFKILSDRFDGEPRMLIYELKIAQQHAFINFASAARFFSDPLDTKTINDVLHDLKQNCDLVSMETPDTALLTCSTSHYGSRNDKIKFILLPDRSWRVLRLVRGKNT